MKTNENAPFLGTAFQYGAILGIIGAVGTLLMAIFQGDPMNQSLSKSLMQGGIGLLLFAVSIWIAVVAVKSYRDKENGGTLTLGMGTLIAFVVFLVAALFSSIAQYMYYAFLVPESTLDSYRELMAQTEAQMQDAPEFLKNMVTKQMEKVLKPTKLLLGFLAPFSLVMNGIIALIIGAVLKKDAPLEIDEV